MPPVSQPLPDLLGGVSQLPDHLRAPNKLTEQINSYSHRAKGLMKRPGSQHVALLTADTTGWDHTYLHVIDRDSGERFYLCIVDGDIRLYDAITGAAQAISFPNGLAYFAVPDAEMVAEFTQPNLGGTGVFWFDGTQYTAPSGMNTYRYGPGGAYRFVQPTVGGTVGASMGIFNNMAVQESIVVPPPPPDIHAATLGFVTSDFPVASPNCGAEMDVYWEDLDAFQGSYNVWITLRQEGAANDKGIRYILDLVLPGGGTAQPGDVAGAWRIGRTTAGSPQTYSTLATSATMALPELRTWYNLRFTAVTDGSGNVVLTAYLDGEIVVQTTHAFGTGETLAGAGYAGFGMRGWGFADPGPGSPFPTGGTFVDNFKISSGRSFDEALPFGLGPLYKCLTVGDRTYICNTLVKVDTQLTTTTAAVDEALVYVRQADYSTTYTVIIQYGPGTISKSHTTTDGSTPASRASITTEYIAEQLKVALAADATLSAQGFTFARTGSVIYIARPTNTTAFNVICRDGMADDALIAIKGSVQRFEDLPTQCKDGVILEVKGDPGSEFDNYFVEFEEVGESGTASGVWRECPKPGEEYQLDPATMPWVLERTPNGEWEIKQGEWNDRECGSLVTNPFPSFVGFPIKEMFYAESRLGFCSNENFILSETSKPYNFFRKSAKALYDSDVIDVKEAKGGSMVWQNVVHWDGSPVAWSNTAQVELSHGDGPLTPKTISLNRLTSLENRPSVAPKVVGDRIFYHAEFNGQTRIGELYVPQFTGKLKAIDATEEVPSYVTGIPVGMAGSDKPGILAVISSEDTDTVFVHSYLWAADTKVQSSWSKWTMPAGSTVVGVDVYLGKVALIVVRSDGVYLERMDIGTLDETTATTPVLIDRQIASSATGVSAVFSSGETEWTIPYTQASGLVVVRVSDGAVIPTTQVDSNTVRTTGSAGDLTAVSVLIGVSYSRSLTLSRIYRRSVRRNNEVSESEERLRLGYVTFICDGPGAISVGVTPTGRSQYTYTRAGEERFKVPVMTKNDAAIVVTDTSVLPCAISGLEWEGSISSRTRRL